MEPDELINERRSTHGDWKKQSARAQAIKKAVLSDLEIILHDHQREALEMICVKLSRIITGDPNEPDHWDDIAGYALLGKKGYE